MKKATATTVRRIATRMWMLSSTHCKKRSTTFAGLLVLSSVASRQVLPAHALAEDPVGPALVEKDQRQQDRRNYGHHPERVGARGGVVDSQVETCPQAGHHNSGVQRHEERRSYQCDRGPGGGEGPALPSPTEKPADCQHGPQSGDRHDARHHALA